MVRVLSVYCFCESKNSGIFKSCCWCCCCLSIRLHFKFPFLGFCLLFIKFILVCNFRISIKILQFSENCIFLCQSWCSLMISVSFDTTNPARTYYVFCVFYFRFVFIFWLPKVILCTRWDNWKSVWHARCFATYSKQTLFRKRLE